MRKIIHSLKELKLFAKEIAVLVQPGDVVGLVGELGAGKTTFVQFLAKALGVKARVNSPTFLVMKVYNANTANRRSNNKKKPVTRNPELIHSLVHIDAYRLKSAEDLEALGAMEYIGAPETITVVEWADRVKKILPKKTKWIHFNHGKHEGERIAEL